MQKEKNKIIISRTPVRISFFGGGTDYPAFYKKHKGFNDNLQIHHLILAVFTGKKRS